MGRGTKKVARIPADTHITYQLQFRKCGKARCGTCRDGAGHGPYWYAYWREGSRLRSGYIGKHPPASITPQAAARAEARVSSLIAMGSVSTVSNVSNVSNLNKVASAAM